MHHQSRLLKKNCSINFINDNKETFHLSLIIYTPDGKVQTRVSNLYTNQIKSYAFPVNTEIFIADNKQEAFAMKGNDIKSSGVKPFIVLTNSDDKIDINLSLIK